MHKVILQAVALSGVAIAAGTTSSTACNYTALASRLSSTSSIILPGSSDFNDTVARWSNLEPPTANLVVVPGTEDDVVQTVSIAHMYSMIQYHKAHTGHVARLFDDDDTPNSRSNSQTSARCPSSPPTACTAPSRRWAP